MSEFDRRTGVKRLRVRGLKTVRFCATLKAIGINIFRATAVRMAINFSKGVPRTVESELYHVYFIFKERFYSNLYKIKCLFVQYSHNSIFELKSVV